ncbi:hypothetical protein CEXT_21331 [Caerostris extrusa]|uniref:Uncharacterized protein n=1 Tax=Caerostris extrusa TaxID=172846 RepID=A0AAV4Q5Z0_CAEEX|nr:hypothetical protein CEXT_21331 [Caerostris extrusa]
MGSGNLSKYTEFLFTAGLFQKACQLSLFVALQGTLSSSRLGRVFPTLLNQPLCVSCKLWHSGAPDRAQSTEMASLSSLLWLQKINNKAAVFYTIKNIFGKEQHPDEDSTGHTTECKLKHNHMLAASSVPPLEMSIDKLG